LRRELVIRVFFPRSHDTAVRVREPGHTVWCGSIGNQIYGVTGTLQSTVHSARTQ
jgi:hypothetical protein